MANNRGGFREGAGRKKGSSTKTIEEKRKNRTFTATALEWQQIVENAEAAGKPVGMFIRDRAMIK